MFYERFQELCRLHGRKETPVVQDMGLSPGTLGNWKAGREPTARILRIVAAYFGVTVDDLLSDEPITVAEKPDDVPPNALPMIDGNNIYLAPVFESVSAGYGVLANSVPLGFQPCVCATKEEAETTLFIRVKGDSMSPKIDDGDLVQVLKVTSVDSGSLAVILIEGEEGVVKQVVYGNGFIELRSYNPYYPPRRFEGANVTKCRVVGLVRMILKRP